jgi:hypothetical protein
MFSIQLDCIASHCFLQSKTVLFVVVVVVRCRYPWRASRGRGPPRAGPCRPCPASIPTRPRRSSGISGCCLPCRGCGLLEQLLLLLMPAVWPPGAARQRPRSPGSSPSLSPPGSSPPSTSYSHIRICTFVVLALVVAGHGETLTGCSIYRLGRPNPLVGSSSKVLLIVGVAGHEEPPAWWCLIDCVQQPR